MFYHNIFLWVDEITKGLLFFWAFDDLPEAWSNSVVPIVLGGKKLYFAVVLWIVLGIYLYVRALSPFVTYVVNRFVLAYPYEKLILIVFYTNQYYVVIVKVFLVLFTTIQHSNFKYINMIWQP